MEFLIFALAFITALTLVVRLTRLHVRSELPSTGNRSPQSVEFQARTNLCCGETTSVVAPSWSRASRGSVNSTCSKPSSTRMATTISLRLIMALPRS